MAGADVTVECDVGRLVMLDAGALTPAAARASAEPASTGPAPAVRRTFGILRPQP